MRRCRIFWFRVSGIQTELLLDGREIGGMVGRGTLPLRLGTSAKQLSAALIQRKHAFSTFLFDRRSPCPLGVPKWSKMKLGRKRNKKNHTKTTTFRVIPCTKVSNPWPRHWDDKLQWRPDAPAFAGFCGAGHRRFWRDWLQWVLGSLAQKTSVGILQKNSWMFADSNEINLTTLLLQHTHKPTGRIWTISGWWLSITDEHGSKSWTFHLPKPLFLGAVSESPPGHQWHDSKIWPVFLQAGVLSTTTFAYHW